MHRVSKQQVVEWIENPVTIAFKEFAEYTRDVTIASKGIDAFHPFQANRTQELIAGLNGEQTTWDIVVDALSEGQDMLDLFEMMKQEERVDQDEE